MHTPRLYLFDSATKINPRFSVENLLKSVTLWTLYETSNICIYPIQIVRLNLVIRSSRFSLYLFFYGPWTIKRCMSNTPIFVLSIYCLSYSVKVRGGGGSRICSVVQKFAAMRQASRTRYNMYSFSNPLTSIHVYLHVPVEKENFRLRRWN